MSSPLPHEITRLLQAWRHGDLRARDAVLSAVYTDLHRLAHAYMRRERDAHTLQTTDVVHEAYLRLGGQSRMEWRCRAQFLGVAAQMMRRVLVDHARAHSSRKRGGAGRIDVPFEEGRVPIRERAPVLLALDEALTRLARTDARKARVVELRWFGGLSVDETAGVLGIAQITVIRDWTLAKAWLRREITSDD